MAAVRETRRELRGARTAVASLVAWSSLLLDAGARDGALALMDQAVFSAASFLTTIMVGRAGTRHELGTYSLGFTIVLVIVCIENALIAAPYTVYANRLHGKRRAEYAGSALVHCVVLCGLAAAGLAISAWILSRGIGPQELAPVLCALAGAIPFVLVRQFARELTFAHLKVLAVLILDVVVAAVQVGGLAYLAATGRLSAVTAHQVVGLACAVGALGWFTLARPGFLVRWDQVPQALKQNWNFGRWVLASQMSLSCHSHLIYWLVALRLGIAATGVLAACETVVALTNPFVFGMNNYLGPRVARAFAEGGRPQVRPVVFRAALFLGAVMAVICGFVALFGGRLVGLLYGEVYAGRGHAVAVLAAAIYVSVLGQSPSLGLLAMERSDLAFRLRLHGLCVTGVTAVCLVQPYGILGAAYALLAGHLTTTAGACIAYRKIVAAAPEAPGPGCTNPADAPLDYQLQPSERCIL